MRQKRIRVCKEILGVDLNNDSEESTKALSWEELLLKLTGEDPRICPCCGEGSMVRKARLSPIINSPPVKAIV